MIRSLLLAPTLLLAGCSSIPQSTTIQGYTIVRGEVEDQAVVSMRETVTTANLSAAFAQALPAAYAFAKSNGGEISGKPLAIYHRFVGDQVDVEMACPVASTIAATGEIHSREIPGGTVIVTSHYGSYHQLSKAHDAMKAWLEKFGVERRGPCWEVYVDDPTTVDPAKVRTDIYYPIH